MHDGLEETSMILQGPAALSAFPDPVKVAGSLKEVLFVSSVHPQSEALAPWRSVRGFDMQIHAGAMAPVSLMDRAASSAKGRYLVFLSHDIKPGPEWLREILRPVSRDEAAAAASAVKIKKSRFAGKERREQRQWILAPASCAFCMDASWFWDLKGFDRDLGLPHALTDLGFRLWISGGTMVSAGTCTGNVTEDGETSLHGLYGEIRDRLCTIYKNYEKEHMASRLSLHILEALHRSAALSHLEANFFAFPKRAGEIRRKPPALEPQSLALLLGIQYLTENLPAIRLKRAQVQALRKVRDRDIFSRTGDPFTISNRSSAAPAEDWRIMEDLLHISVPNEETHG